MAETRIHATCIALGGVDRPLGVLLRGPSGAGKSDLALRLIDRGARLVSDDQTVLRAEEGRIWARAPGPIAGRMEVRGLGIADLPRLAEAPVRLVVDLKVGQHIERLPEAASCALLEVELPCLKLDPFHASAPAKLRLALDQACADGAGDEAAAPAASQAAHRPGARRLVLVTGLSGAGRTAALNTLEDLGYEAIHNLPLELLDQMVGDGDTRAIAVGVDIRTRNFAVEPFLEQLDRHLEPPALDLRLLFIDCDDEALRRRYTETRRPHPLARDRPVIDGIKAERRLVLPLRARADLVVDTSALSPGEFRQVLKGHFRLDGAGGMSIFVVSFSYRHGLPREADLVFDVRFLANPHYQEALRPLTGLDARVAEFVRADPGFAPFFSHLTDMLQPLLPRYQSEGKSYLTIAFGCTGGRHRSVMVSERLAEWLRRQQIQVMLVHREIEQNADQALRQMSRDSRPN